MNFVLNQINGNESDNFKSVVNNIQVPIASSSKSSTIHLSIKESWVTAALSHFKDIENDQSNYRFVPVGIRGGNRHQ